jgi:hypothetical protein
MERLDGIEELATRLKRVSTCTAMDILLGAGEETLVMRDVRPLLPVKGPISGRARTLRFLRRPLDEAYPLPKIPAQK